MADSRRARDRLVVAMSDLHCGHWSGVTPPGWQQRSAHPARAAWQEHAWASYLALAQRIGRPDVLLVVGDAVSLTDPQWGAGEQVEGDPLQCRTMAVQAIQEWRARTVVIVRGTARHVTGAGIDLEDLIAEAFDVQAHDHAFCEVNGHIIDAKHHVGRTQTNAAMLAEYRANREWYEDGVQPLAQTIVRGHIHYGTLTQPSGWTGLTLPGLQGPTTYGARRCRWPVHWGLAWATIDTGGNAQWHVERQPIVRERHALIAC
jgi:hypothetical protein